MLRTTSGLLMRYVLFNNNVHLFWNLLFELTTKLQVYFQKLCNLDAKLGPAIREEGTQFNFAQMPQPPAIPGQGAPAACLLPVNWNVGPGA